MSEAEEYLDNLLTMAVDKLDKVPCSNRTLKEADVFGTEQGNTSNGSDVKENNEVICNSKKKLSNLIHSGDTDSSDDEDNKYFEEQRYNDCGKEIKRLLQNNSPPTLKDFSTKHTETWNTELNKHVNLVNESVVTTQDIFTDPIFGLRIINPQVSFTTLQDRMVGRETVSFSKIKRFVTNNISEKNWVIGGVIINKSCVKTSQKGNQFLIWSLSDLKDDIKMVSLFLFGNAYKQLWKISKGTVVGILNPSVLDRKDGSKDEVCLSIDNAQKVMIIGKSKDFGTCRSMKKNGEQCTAIVNTNQSEFCVYHIKQEYQKCSKRSELQSNFTGRGLTALRNKVLGKNEVFYAGRSYTAIPAKRNTKLEQKDYGRLQALNNVNENVDVRVKNLPQKRKVAALLEVPRDQKAKDLMLLEKLAGSNTKTNFEASHSAEVTLQTSKDIAISTIEKLKTNSANNVEEKKILNKKITPLKSDNGSCNSNFKGNSILVLGNDNGIVDLNITKTPRQMNRAKLNALNYIQKNGPLKKADPNKISELPSNRKRAGEIIENNETDSKRQKVENGFNSDRFKKMIETSSKHLDLLHDRENEEQQKYFHKLEVKEKMEEKMVNTFKVDCKAVRCLKCKYTNFSASQFCKDEKHPLKVFDAVKRFFKCSNCANRLQCLQMVPTSACKNCGCEKWEKTGMMKEKTVTVTHKLSIRGGEQKFVNSLATDSNIDLLVPDE